MVSGVGPVPPDVAEALRQLPDRRAAILAIANPSGVGPDLMVVLAGPAPTGGELPAPVAGMLPLEGAGAAGPAFRPPVPAVVKADQVRPVSWAPEPIDGPIHSGGNPAG